MKIFKLFAWIIFPVFLILSCEESAMPDGEEDPIGDSTDTELLTLEEAGIMTFDLGAHSIGLDAVEEDGVIYAIGYTDEESALFSSNPNYFVISIDTTGVIINTNSSFDGYEFIDIHYVDGDEFAVVGKQGDQGVILILNKNLEVVKSAIARKAPKSKFNSVDMDVWDTEFIYVAGVDESSALDQGYLAKYTRDLELVKESWLPDTEDHMRFKKVISFGRDIRVLYGPDRSSDRRSGFYEFDTDLELVDFVSVAEDGPVDLSFYVVADPALLAEDNVSGDFTLYTYERGRSIEGQVRFSDIGLSDFTPLNMISNGRNFVVAGYVSDLDGTCSFSPRIVHIDKFDLTVSKIVDMTCDTHDFESAIFSCRYGDDFADDISINGIGFILNDTGRENFAIIRLNRDLEPK